MGAKSEKSGSREWGGLYEKQNWQTETNQRGKEGILFMQKQSFMRADEVAQELGISKSHAYKVIHGLNEELQEKGYLTISGRVNREFFMEKYYYTKTAKEES